MDSSFIFCFTRSSEYNRRQEVYFHALTSEYSCHQPFYPSCKVSLASYTRTHAVLKILRPKDLHPSELIPLYYLH